jgi:hypothetical protein
MAWLMGGGGVSVAVACGGLRVDWAGFTLSRLSRGSDSDHFPWLVLQYHRGCSWWASRWKLHLRLPSASAELLRSGACWFYATSTRAPDGPSACGVAAACTPPHSRADGPAARVTLIKKDLQCGWRASSV